MKQKIGIRISPEDNVITVVEDVTMGDDVRYMATGSPRLVTAKHPVPLGHKLATEDIEPGETIIKYNQTIGTASKPIRQGEHVHVQNVRSAVQGVEREG